MAAYIACLRFATRFNEASGTIVQFLEYFGVKPDSHVGASIERMRTGLVTLCEMGYLKHKVTDMRRMGPNQGISCQFKPNCGWRIDEYPLAILFSIKEINQAVRTAGISKWTGVDNLVDVLYLTATLRSYMDTPAEIINPTVRFEESVAFVDYNTCMSSLDITERKLQTRLKRMQNAGLGVYQVVVLEHPTIRKKPKMILAVNKSDKAASILTKARKNLRSYYDGYTLKIER